MKHFRNEFFKWGLIFRERFEKNRFGFFREIFQEFLNFGFKRTKFSSNFEDFGFFF